MCFKAIFCLQRPSIYNFRSTESCRVAYMVGMILNICDYYTQSIPLILIRLFMPICNYFLLVIYFSNHGSLYCPPCINSEAQ